MVDDLLIALQRISQTLIPVAGFIVLVVLAMVLFQIYRFLKALPNTIEKVEKLLDSTNDSVEQLEQPLEALSNISGTVDMVNQATAEAVKSVASYTMENSDVIVNWFKKDKKRSKDKPVEEKTEEDFGIYE